MGHTNLGNTDSYELLQLVRSLPVDRWMYVHVEDAHTPSLPPPRLPSEGGPRETDSWWTRWTPGTTEQHVTGSEAGESRECEQDLHPAFLSCSLHFPICTLFTTNQGRAAPSPTHASSCSNLQSFVPQRGSWGRGQDSQAPSLTPASQSVLITCTHCVTRPGSVTRIRPLPG